MHATVQVSRQLAIINLPEYLQPALDLIVIWLRRHGSDIFRWPHSAPPVKKAEVIAGNKKVQQVPEFTNEEI